MIGHSLNSSLAAAAILAAAAMADTAFSAQSPPGPGGGKAPSMFHIQYTTYRGLACARQTTPVATLRSQYAHAFRGRRRQRRRAPAIEAGGGQSRKERPSSRRRSRVQQHTTTAQCDQSIGCCSDNKNTASAAVIVSRPRQDLWPQFNLSEKKEEEKKMLFQAL